MKIVADTNTFIAVSLNEPERKAIIDLTEGCELVAPDVLPFELGNALTAMMKKGTLQPHEISSSWDTIRQIPVELKRTDIKYALEIAVQFGIYAYDAYFLECASGLRCPLITLDRRMKGVALEMGIFILE
jgi:predicted nucleic acid-binding protein